ncbi:peptidoglycan D,D-transpeptidase FtsI family protein [Natribacillus halophilus]|uniref:serine-type D-Ala-D-Ala carboxypeptidase n=1 Tax=Natribacillus halophilus TaxID=549003 RepID=A0A1G8JP61_9BACI|nr:penicillin-binding protein 2 [Natribacillus halophilus]SDI32881.1 Cell division protein FtsI/penicillin-binding protein 2 [Natribacillus halophilus]
MVREKRKNHIPIRLNVLFFAVFILFSVLILRLGYIQIVQGEEYEEMVNNNGEQTANVDAPRGLMFDRNGNTVVDNELELTLTYTNRPGNDEEMLEIAERLTQFLDIDEDDIDDINEREWQDYWLQTREDEADELVSDEEEAELEEDDDIYELQLERLPEEEVIDDIGEEEQETVAIWTEMMTGYNYAPHRIARGLDEETAHALSELMHELPGIDIMRDSVRAYPYGESFSTFFGSTGQITEGELDQYLGEGYERTDIVGNSQLEDEYESVLRGEKAEITTDADGNESTDPGARGNDLVLTIDMALQQEVEDVIDDNIGSASGGTFLNEPEAHVIMMEPDTGDILSMASYDNDVNLVMGQYEIGSTVKMATVLAGYESGVIGHGTVYEDTPINLPASQPVSSWQNMGAVNDIDAIRRSSNVYMSRIAMEMADYELGVDGRDWSGADQGFDMLRNHYAQFGLGTETGIDLPNEVTGTTDGYNIGNYLMLPFGQYDTYTPMQMAQFAATMANGGDRMQPTLVREILEPATGDEESGSVVRQNSPEVMNSVDNSNEDFERMQEGMRQVMQQSGSNGGTASDDFDDADYNPAGKTGTAQVSVHEVNDGYNQGMVAYAPHDDPEVAIAVIVPETSTSDEDSGLANSITRDALDAYFDLQEDGAEPEESDDEDEIYQDPDDDLG